MGTKIGIIRCDAVSDNCAGWNCFSAIRNRTEQFKIYDEIELIGFDSCGGCARGKPDKILSRAQRLKDKGAEVIHLSTCVVGTPNTASVNLSPCPFENIFAQAIQEKIGIPIVRGTH
jgi:predicted metal-binding protein